MSMGLAKLIDRSGNDRFSAKGLIPTNYGTPGLTDAWAQGVGLGIRNLVPGGIGILRDGQGIDSYDAGSFGQGGGYYYGIGIFEDSGDNNDTYLGSRYNFGWGAHAGLGYFSDHAGDDYYRTRQIVAAGLAWDHSLAFFEDRSGDDEYVLGDFSLGASAHNSVAVFYDGAGKDRYLGVSPARANEGLPNFSLFVDVGEEDNYFETGQPGSECGSADGASFFIIVSSISELESSVCPQKR
jgi:hypothetical protein